MADTCSDCQRKDERITDLEQENSAIRSEVDEESTRADEEEEFCDNARDARDTAFAALRDEKGKELSMLRRLEFCLHGLCQICKGVLEHKVGCDLKLAIFRVDHELACRTFESSIESW
jgi:predicted  nucleic acid-binding Zn-ribbon protein